MPERTPGTLARTALEILERMGFLFGEPSADPAPSAPARVVHGRIVFQGEASGVLELFTSVELACALAGNVLGCEPEDAPAGSELDALGEFMNVMLGHFLTTIAPRAAVFDVEPPCVSLCATSAEWTEFLGHGGVSALEVEGAPLLLRLVGSRRRAPEVVR